MDDGGAKRTIGTRRYRRWRVAPAAVEATSLATALDVSPLVAQVLCRRGLDDAEKARDFLEPKLSGLSDPKGLSGCERSAARLVEAIRADEPIALYGDYDVDGVTATAILFHTIKRAAPTARVLRYVPHRIDEGYGLNTTAIERLADDGAKVIVTVDCGITALEPARAAVARGVDLIITDHHAPRSDGDLPLALALVHPRLKGGDDENRSFGELCGAGVAYKLAWQLARAWCGSERVTDALREVLLDLLPLAALGTIADVVPLVSENRVIATHGLRRIKGTRLVGLNALIDAASLRGETIDSYHVGFVLGPRLNACGRLGHAREAVTLLTDARPDDAARIAQSLNAINEQRRSTERAIFEQARRMVVEAGYDRDEVRAIVLGHDEWHPGVVGIVCSRLVEAFGRPTVLVTTAGELASGSARSIDGFDLMAAFIACKEHLENFGGHTMAAGLKLKRERLDAFRSAMIRYAAENLTTEDLIPAIDIDAETAPASLTLRACEQLQQLAPFGRSNPPPIFVMRSMTLSNDARSMGRDGRHLTLTISSEGVEIRCVAWGMGELAGELRRGQRVDLVGEPRINRFRGRTSVELEVKDLRHAS